MQNYFLCYCNIFLYFSVPNALGNCNAKYGAIDAVSRDLQSYANAHIARSYEYLLMSTHYGNYEKSRAGFEKLFRDFSDSTWEDAINIIKYITKRGGEMDFTNRKDEAATEGESNYELYELQSIAKAIDIQKHLAIEAHNIHDTVSRRKKEHHDPEVSSYLEEEFSHKHAKSIRKLSGYATDLSSMLSTPDSSLALYLFDEYLQKQ